VDCKGKQAVTSPKNADFLRDESTADGSHGGWHDEMDTLYIAINARAEKCTYLFVTVLLISSDNGIYHHTAD